MNNKKTKTNLSGCYSFRIRPTNGTPYPELSLEAKAVLIKKRKDELLKVAENLSKPRKGRLSVNDALNILIEEGAKK